MSISKILSAVLIVLFSLSFQSAMAKDKEYKFNYRGYVSDEINNEDDLKLLKAAEYSLKKGYDYFVITKSRQYDKSKMPKKTGRFGRASSKKPQLRTELIIHLYDADPAVDNAHNAASIKQKINQKYSN